MKQPLTIGPNRVTKRTEHLLPNNVPRYVRVYDNGGESLDRYTIVFTNKRGGYYVAASDDPRGIYSHADGLPDAGKASGYKWPPAIGRRNHLGTRIPVTQLPSVLQTSILCEYCHLWDIPFPTDVALCPQIISVTGPMRSVRPNE